MNALFWGEGCHERFVRGGVPDVARGWRAQGPVDKVNTKEDMRASSPTMQFGEFGDQFVPQPHLAWE